MSKGKLQEKIESFEICPVPPFVLEEDYPELEKLNSYLRRIHEWAKELKELFEEANHNFNEVVSEIQHNATQDTLFERMVLARLKEFDEIWLSGVKQ